MTLKDLKEGVTPRLTKIKNTVYSIIKIVEQKPKTHVVRIKDKDELEDTEWYYNRAEDAWCNRLEKRFDITREMMPLLGKIVAVNESSDKDYDYEYQEIRKGEIEFYAITDDMISEVLNPADYPEYLI